MPALKTYDLFLSHVWRNAQNSEYYRLKKLLNEAPFFVWRDYSVPEHDPLGTRTNKDLLEALDRQIRPVNCFLVISGMYANHREWIQAEIDIATRYEKPIIGIIPRGQERIPVAIHRVAVQLVGWNTASIVTAIRHESI